MKTKLAIFTALAFATFPALGTVSLDFNDEFNTGVSQGFSNASGIATNGLMWGILIDGARDGLKTSGYDLVNITVGSKYILNDNGSATDDVLWTSPTLTVSTANRYEGDLTTGGDGGIGAIQNIPLTDGVGTGDSFHVLWFDGTSVGILSDPSFTIANDGTLIFYGAPFLGVDPNRSAGFRYEGTSGVPTGAVQFFSVPEPSSALLLSAGVLGLLRRRRK